MTPDLSSITDRPDYLLRVSHEWVADPGNVLSSGYSITAALLSSFETALAQREAVLAIHHPMLDEYGEPTKACEECLDAVPCPTVVALGGETE